MMGLRNWHSEAAVLVILTHKVGDMLLCKWGIRLTDCKPQTEASPEKGFDTSSASAAPLQPRL